MAKQQKTILIVEDDPTLRSVYREKFSGEGYRVIEAEDSKTGLKLAKSKKPDLIILDLILPQGNGFELMEKLKKDEKTKKIPIVVLTGLSQDSDRREMISLGAVDYMVKPEAGPSEVIDRIKKHIG